MGYADSEEHRMMRESIRDIASDYDREYWRRHVDEKEFPEEYWNDLARDGWLGVAVPEEYGGAGMGMVEMTLIIEELSRAGGQGGIVFVLTPVFGGIGIERHGTEDQKERYLPAIADGEMRFCMGLTEANAGINTLRTETRARKDGEEYVVDGQKMWISGVENADAMLLITRTEEFDPGDPTRGVTLFVVDDPAERETVSLTPLDVALPWFEVQYQVDIDGLRVHEDQILGEEGGGLALLWDTLNTERIAGAASALGGGLRAVDLAVDYANEREVFGQPIGSHQAVQHPLADSYAKLLAAREITYKAAEKWDRGEDAGTEANVAKLLTSEAGTEAADRAIQTHGGAGFTREYEVFDIWQNMRLTQVAPVPNEMARNFLAEHTLGLPKSY